MSRILNTLGATVVSVLAACGGEPTYAEQVADCRHQVAVQAFGPATDPDHIPATEENCTRAKGLPDLTAACLDASEDPSRPSDCRTLGVPHQRPTEQDYLARACARGEVVTVLCGQGNSTTRAARTTFIFEQ